MYIYIHIYIYIYIWRFPQIGVPLVIIHFYGIFDKKASILFFWVPPFMEPPKKWCASSQDELEGRAMMALNNLETRSLQKSQDFRFAPMGGGLD